MPGHLVARTWMSDPTIHAARKYRRACKYDAFVPDKLLGLPLSFDGTLAGLVSEAEAAVRSLNEVAIPALDPLARLLLRTESIASSKVEGLQLGLREVARAEARVETGQGASTTAMEILANIDAMVLAIDEAARVSRFGIGHIVAIHKRLMERAERKHEAGRIRTQQNWIGGNGHNPCGADFVPPPPEDVGALLADLCEAINDDLLPPVLQAALVHAQFETIHPFEDGNGRTGRALIHVVLRRRGVAPRYVPPISVVIAGTRSRYIAGLTNFRGDRVNQWVEYFADAAGQAARLAKAYLEAVQTLRAEWRSRLSRTPDAPRADAAAWAIIDVLPAHPMISVAVAAAAAGRSKPGSYEAFKQLAAAGVLVPLSKGRRNQSWEVSGLLDLIAGLESGELPERPPNADAATVSP